MFFHLKDAAGKTTQFSVRTFDLKVPSGGIFEDAFLDVFWLTGRARVFVKPNVLMLRPARQLELLAQWSKFPSASSREWNVEFRRLGQTTQMWFNDQFLEELPFSSPYASCDIRMQPGCSLRSVETSPKLDPAKLLTLPVESYPRVGDMPGAKVVLDKTGQEVKKLFSGATIGMPNSVTTGIAIGGLGKIEGAGADDSVSFNWKRSHTDALAETRLFAVPLATYSHAHLLCAVAQTPGKVPSFTVRLTRFAGSRGDAMADTSVTLDEMGLAQVQGTRVGEVSYGGEDARKTVPHGGATT